MSASSGKYWIATGTVFMAFSSGISAEPSVPLSILNLQLSCDSDQCRTALVEVHENTGVDANHLVYIFAAPPGVTFDNAHATGVEVEGSGDTHYVRASDAGAKWLKCEWLAKAKVAGNDPGLAKGYCWIAMKK